jgi:hypothetical protein
MRVPAHSIDSILCSPDAASSHLLTTAQPNKYATHHHSSLLSSQTSLTKIYLYISVMNDPYATAPLSRHTGSHEFRLVELRPSALNGPFKYSLRTYTVDEHCPPYTALSYMWGPSQRYGAIMLNGEAFPVGYSLWSFLRQMRIREQYGNYWIDSICVNQKIVLERNHQVQMMQLIYSNAQSVAVWLGDTHRYGLPGAMDRPPNRVHCPGLKSTEHLFCHCAGGSIGRESRLCRSFCSRKTPQYIAAASG